VSCARSKKCFHFTASCAYSLSTSACSDTAAAQLVPACRNQASLACNACARLEQCCVQKETLQVKTSHRQAQQHSPGATFSGHG
jgi:hypothetical protein